MIKKAIRKRYTVFIQDKAIFIDNANPKNEYWSKVGERQILPWNRTRNKFIVYGFYSLSGKTFFRSDDKFNGSTFIKMIKVHQKYGRVVLIVDRARQHMSKDLKKYLKECSGNGIIKYFPIGSPQLGVIERCCGMCKHDIMHSEYYKTIYDMRYAIIDRMYNRSNRSFLFVKIMNLAHYA